MTDALLRLGALAAVLLMGCVGGGRDTGAPAQADRTVAAGRALTDSFYAGQLGYAWDRMTPALRDEAGGSLEGFREFRAKVRDLIGDEVEVTAEEAVHEAGLDVYRRVTRFSGIGEPIVVQWGVDSAGAIADFFIRPAAPASEVVYETRTALSLPFEGEWYVTAGGRTVADNHHAADYSNRFAYDLVLAADLDRRGPFTHNDDFATWDQPILAPADGRVAALRDGVPDNVPGEIHPDPALRMGNYVVIDHGDGEFSVLGHLRQGSIRVAVNDRVRRGDVVGRAGNSGNSSGPHLHYNLQDRAEPNRGRGLPAQFREYLADDVPVARGEPVRAQRLRRP